MAIKQDSTYSFYIAKYFNDLRIEKGMNTNDVSFLNYGNFSGLIHLLDENNEMIYAKKLDRGEIIDHMLFYDIKKKGSDKARFPGECYTLTTYYYTDWYIFVNGYYSYSDSDLRYITTEQFCNFSFYPELYTSGGGGAGSYQSSTGGNTYLDCVGTVHPCIYELDDAETPFEVGGPDARITNMNQFLNCFNTNQGATLTIYIDQPKNGSGATNYLGEVGHAFIGISQNGTRKHFGFYPSNAVVPGMLDRTSSAMGKDNNHEFDVSLTMEISANELYRILYQSKNPVGIYDLNTYNCTDWVIDISEIVGLDLPEANGTWPYGGGSNPGMMGQAIGNMTLPTGVTRNTNGGDSRANRDGC